MNRYISLGFICSLLLFFMIGVCMADEAPSYLGYVKGGGSSITNSANGTYVITVNDVVPYFHLADGNKSSLIPVERLTNVTFPLNAAVVFSGADNETAFMVEVSNLSLSDGNKSLTLLVKPLNYYEGELLKSFTGKEPGSMDLVESQSTSAGLYFEIKTTPPTNSGCIPNIPWCTHKPSDND